ncbi:MAG: hypothetical protein K8S00_04120, partial [Bacteroidales bacterium]|nr:hypothetical protein [Bacteroidales bacterium]
MNEISEVDGRKIFDDNKHDHRIINAALVLDKGNHLQKVILVTIDINLSLKSNSLNINAEDFET